MRSLYPKISRFCALIVVSMLSLAALAVPAKHGLLTMKQADGSTLRVKLLGDERHHVVLSEDGYVLLDKDGLYYFAHINNNKLEPSAVRAADIDKRTGKQKTFVATLDKERQLELMEAQRAEAVTARRPAAQSAPMHTSIGLFDDRFPVRGNVKGIVVLVEYKDVKFNLNDPADYFTRLMQEPGFSDYGATGSCRDYFLDQSMGVFDPQFDVYGPITLSQNMSYYGGNDWAGNDKNPQKMVIEACQQLDSIVDFTQYDTNGDGEIDNVYVFYAGMGEASGGAANTVWPHSWDVTAAESHNYYFDGVLLDHYACSNEWEGGKPDGIGTFCHEFSHVMGLPDLYATSYTGAFTPGSWSVMDSGNYNNDSRTPPAYSIYERYSLGWMEPKVLDGPANVALDNVTTTNEGCIIPTGDPYEFFLLENRQQQGWDSYIPGHGMLIWHIDFNEGVWANNVVNNTSSHQYVDIEEADNSKNNYSRAGDSFPGTSNVTSFTDDTNPSMKTWRNKRLELPITNITETDGQIRFRVAGGLSPVKPVTAYPGKDVTRTSFTASWSEADTIVESYRLSVYTKAEGMASRKQYLDGYEKKDMGKQLSAVIEGLYPATDYYYEVYVNDGEWLSEPSNVVEVRTDDPTLDYLTPEALQPTDVEEEQFTANWKKLPGATNYDVIVNKLVLGDCLTDGCDFTGGIRALAEGWTTNSKLTYSNEAFAGEAMPSLRLSTQESYVATPLYDSDVETFAFWHRGSSAPEANSLNVYLFVDGAWMLFDTLPIENAEGGQKTEYKTLPYGTRSVKIVYHMEDKKGAVAIDDILVGWNRQFEEQPLAEYNPMRVADTDHLVVEGLVPGSHYNYNVQATDGTYDSKRSKSVRVITLGYDPMAVKALEYSGNDKHITVCDINGRIVYRGRPTSLSTLQLPKGIYIVRQGNKVAKYTK